MKHLEGKQTKGSKQRTLTVLGGGGEKFYPMAVEEEQKLTVG